ncbi:MAG: hypothetical protein K6T83_09335 [Alicyclobacillus sp.]|nr:hypothetical protein [Alicyclobacillus sp.]
MTSEKKILDRSPAPINQNYIEQYYSGKISVEDYISSIAKLPIADQIRRESEKRIKGIFRKVAKV